MQSRIAHSTHKTHTNMSLDWFDAECERGAILQREHAKDKAMLQENLFTSDELFFSLRKKSRGAFDATKFEEQRKGAIKVSMIDKDFWDNARITSICDHCKKVTTQLPKMMLCAKCMGRRYCSKECQKNHWKDGHKKLCAAEFATVNESKTTRLCQKIMALLSLEARPGKTPVLNAWTGRFKQHLLRFGVRGAIYVPVCDSVELAFIPMPIEIMDILLPATPEGEFSYGNAIEMSHDNPTAMLLLPTKKPAPGKNAGILENTAVHAFIVERAPTGKVYRLTK